MSSSNLKKKLFFFVKNGQWHANIVACLLNLWDCLLFVLGGADGKIKHKSYFETLYSEKGNDQFLRKALL